MRFVRVEAIRELQRHLDHPEAVAATLDRLRDEDALVRLWAARSLASRPEHRAAIARLLDDACPAVAIQSVAILCRRTPRAGAWEVLSRGGSGWYRSSGVLCGTPGDLAWLPIQPLEAVGRLAVLDPVRDSVAAALDDPEPEHRGAAARALRCSSPEPRIADRLAALVEEDIPVVAGAAYDTLARWEDP